MKLFLFIVYVFMVLVYVLDVFVDKLYTLSTLNLYVFFLLTIVEAPSPTLRNAWTDPWKIRQVIYIVKMRQSAANT